MLPPYIGDNVIELRTSEGKIILTKQGNLPEIDFGIFPEPIQQLMKPQLLKINYRLREISFTIDDTIYKFLNGKYPIYITNSINKEFADIHCPYTGKVLGTSYELLHELDIDLAERILHNDYDNVYYTTTSLPDNYSPSTQPYLGELSALTSPSNEYVKSLRIDLAKDLTVLILNDVTYCISVDADKRNLSLYKLESGYLGKLTVSSSRSELKLRQLDHTSNISNIPELVIHNGVTLELIAEDIDGTMNELVKYLIAATKFNNVEHRRSLNMGIDDEAYLDNKLFRHRHCGKTKLYKLLNAAIGTCPELVKEIRIAEPVIIQMIPEDTLSVDFGYITLTLKPVEKPAGILILASPGLPPRMTELINQARPAKLCGLLNSLNVRSNLKGSYYISNAHGHTWEIDVKKSFTDDED